MFIVYSQNEKEKKFLQQQFIYKQNYFVVPFINTKPITDILDQVFYEFYKRNQSILIEKIKIFISSLLDLTISLPLLRDILNLIKKKDNITQIYRKQLILMDKFLCDQQQSNNQQSPYQQNEQFTQFKKQSLNQFQYILNTHKDECFQSIDIYPLTSIQNLSQLESLKKISASGEQHHNLSVDKTQSTKDQYDYYSNSKIIDFLSKSRKQISQKTSLSQLDSPNKYGHIDQQFINFSNFNTLKQKKTSLDKSNEELLTSFRKKRTSAITSMILKDQSLRQIIRQDIKKQNLKKKAHDQMLQTIISIKSNQYNKKVKTIVLNRKLKQRKKTLNNPKNYHNQNQNQNKTLRRIRSDDSLFQGFIDEGKKEQQKIKK